MAMYDDEKAVTTDFDLRVKTAYRMLKLHQELFTGMLRTNREGIGSSHQSAFDLLR